MMLVEFIAAKRAFVTNTGVQPTRCHLSQRQVFVLLRDIGVPVEKEFNDGSIPVNVTDLEIDGTQIVESELDGPHFVGAPA